MALDNPLLNNFIAALEQLSNPEMVFKVCYIHNFLLIFHIMIVLFVLYSLFFPKVAIKVWVS